MTAPRRRALTSLLRALDSTASSSTQLFASSSSSSSPMLLARTSGGSRGMATRAAASSSSSSSSSPSAPASRRKPAGYVWNELMFWHNPGEIGDLGTRVQPTRHLEHAETKRRLHNLVALSGLLQSPAAAGGAAGAAEVASAGRSPSPSAGERRRQAGPALVEIEPRMATVAELERAHDPNYVAKVIKMSADPSASVHRIGDESAFAPGGFEVAALSAGAALTATEAVLSGDVAAAYALSRPPGHHATRATGGGFCLFNNVAVSALHALEGSWGGTTTERAAAAASPSSSPSSSSSPPSPPIRRVAVVDFDVHHGNGTQDIFWRDDRVLTISLHQAGNYPLNEGGVDEVGAGRGEGHNINVPLPPGSGSGAYRAAFDRVVIPALDAYTPDLVLVSAGYDACYMDPLGQMMLGSHDYRYFMRRLRAAAARHSRGRMVAVHEGGYSDAYAPFCGLAAIEAMCGAATRSRVADPYWADVSAFGYQALQPWQDSVLSEVERGPLRLLRARCAERSGGGGGDGGGRRRVAGAAAGAGAVAGRGGKTVPPPDATSVAASVMGGRQVGVQQPEQRRGQLRVEAAPEVRAAHG